MTAMGRLWEPTTVDEILLENRLAMAPMTRDRSTPGGVPTGMNAEYYARRASTGLIVTEVTQPSDDGRGYLPAPGNYTDEHIAGWRGVSGAVHIGRISHPSNAPHGRRPAVPSAVRPGGRTFTASGPQKMPRPRALSTREVAGIERDFRRAAAAAIAAGADGAEIHAANGYLVQQFLSRNANRRTDRYGGPVPNRILFAVGVASAVAEEIGPGRTRVSPGNPFDDIVEDDVAGLYGALLDALAPLGLAHVHVLHGGNQGLRRSIRHGWPGALPLNRGGADIQTRARDIEDGLADVFSVGAMVLAHPDLADRIKTGAPLDEPDRGTFYGGAEGGYAAYPTTIAAADRAA